MNARQQSLYRYLTMWADFTPAEAKQYCDESLPVIHSSETWRAESVGRIYCPMEQNVNRRVA